MALGDLTEGVRKTGVPNLEDPWLPVAEPSIGPLEAEYVLDAVNSGWVSSAGPYIERFERGMADFCGARHAVAVCSGTTALHLALHGLGIGPGDEVIVPALTFVATAHAVLMVGATPVLADVHPDTWCLDPAAVERAISPKTRAIIPVHLYGQPADVPAMRALAPTGVHLVEDAAEAHGATLHGVSVGKLGDVGVFSFYGNKVMTTGEGGMIVTDDEVLAERLRYLRGHGMSPDRHYFHTELSFNYRMTNLQAALGVAQLERVADFIAAKGRIMNRYRELLGSRRDLTLNPTNFGDSVYWMASAIVADDAALSRDGVRAALRERNIETRPFFVALGELPHLAQYRQVGVLRDECPVAARLARSGLNLPSGCSLTDSDIARVAGGLVEALGQ
jgi:perosamine synthetase